MSAVQSSLALALTSAPLARRACTTSRWPFWEVSMSAVAPSFSLALTSAPLASSACEPAHII
jgi:hypothetical protein